MANKLYDQLCKLTDKGGAAFPFSVELNDGGEVNWPGMTLRDYFAGQALNGLTGLAAFNDRGGKLSEPEHFAHWSYALADAMLKERDRG